MGGTSTKFKKHLQRGDEYAAMRLYSNSPELKALDPNWSYGDSHNHNTLLYYAAKHGMKHLLRAFLNEHNGNPNKKNNSNETALHAVCSLSPQSPYSAQERRAACVTILLNWQGVELSDGRREKIRLSVQNNDGNTALHLAAASGLQYCVDLMLSHGGAPIFKTNNQKETACDLAVKNGNETLARKLESRMVFGEDLKDIFTVVDDYDFGEEETYAGLRTQDLQEAKDQLLVETADMLNLPLFTAEALLRNNEWSREILLERWVRDPDKCCQIAGVQVPMSVQSTKKFYLNGLLQQTNLNEEAQLNVNDQTICDICLNELPLSDCSIKLCCEHKFCNSCWKQYLTYKIKRKDSSNICCPALHCHILVPTELIENVVSPEMARRYFDLNIESFVESNRSIKWCPVPNCGLAVRLPISRKPKPNSKIARSVDCGRGHYFCWECMGDAHTPCSCQQWSQWMTKISEVKPDKIRETTAEYEEAANSLWLVTNSKPCPNCNSPIQKNEGCNHMKCSKCKFEFCWICQESWKKHGSATGGFFRCNRMNAVCKADEKRGLLVKEAQQKNKQSLELSKFLHYYTKFKKHEVTRTMEELFVEIVKNWRIALSAALNISEDDERTKFVEDAVVEVQKAKRVLCASYVYGFYMLYSAYNRNILEFMQNEVEEVTEKLSGMVLRQYLCNPRSAIINTTSILRRKRHEFINAISDGSISLKSMPSIPPNVTKPKSTTMSQKHINATAKDLLKKAIGDSIQIDPDNPWIVDSKGRHRNLTAILDWPESCSDEEEETELDRALAVSVFGQCKMEHCKKARVRNPRTSKFHEYCSLRCKNTHKTLLEERKKEKRTSIVGTFAMDLIVALEMSRLQMIKDAQLKKKSEIEEASCSKNYSEVVEDSNDDDQQLQMALQMSLDEIAMTKSRNVSKSTNDNETILLTKNIPENTVLKTDIPLILPKCSGIKLDDGVFKVGDLHKNSYYLDFSEDIYSRMENKNLRRSLSFGDLLSRRDLYKNNRRYCVNVYHMNSDDRQDKIDRKRGKLNHGFQVLPRRTASILMEINNNGECRAVTSLDDSNIAAPISSDKKLCNILAQLYWQNSSKPSSVTLPKRLSKIGKTAALDTSDETLENESKTPDELPIKPELNIRIEKFSSHSEDSADNDISADIESDTGIPKSPTLFISGVSINRTPETKSPVSGRQLRSASLTVPKFMLKPLYKGTSADNLTSCKECNVVHTNKAHSYQTLFSEDRMCASANMADKSRCVFTFPKSMTDGELFSTLHIDRNKLSSDDFHEALFLKRRKHEQH
ncbi:ankyrin repeat and IBR domain-containing protein 1-like [Metopolophium dirhodum]|uniref:ankyrin repeat and IBR domain-containing protein 1-like n=1 Tax=Metopolophium dirhodum TaxID=44670 RepID=UPI00298FB67C|nr:ankyrin repeat and IBR domain-containing protein 1-like [Metopolophium dirhodum]